MTSPLATLRRPPQVTPEQFLKSQPGCWVQYYDDTAAKDPAKALSARSFDLSVARRKQQERCAVCYSLQPFAQSRTQRELLCVRNLGVDVDLIPRTERSTVTAERIDRRKDEYLSKRLLPLPLKPHWLVETQHGFHAVFRIQAQRSQEGVADAMALNRRLVRVLRGDENAVLLTQVLRVPGTLQFKDPASPFLCRLLVDNAATVAPYTLNAVRGVLDALEVFHGAGGGQRSRQTAQDAPAVRPAGRWREGLGGVPEGQRNATAASVVGSILGRLPEDLWETAGWGGLKEWNGRNGVPLPDRELRAVYESITRRERAGRGGGVSVRGVADRPRVTVRIEVLDERGPTAAVRAADGQDGPADVNRFSGPPE